MIQQFLTDVGATHNPAGFEQANGHLETAQSSLTSLKKLSPHLEDQMVVIGEKITITHDGGVEMAQKYIDEGIEAGNQMMADEVRTLASRTQKSTQEIQGIIERLQSGSREAVNAMDTSQKKASTSVEYAEKAGASLNSITQMIAQVLDMNVQTASSVEEQSAVAEEINHNIVRISDESTAVTSDVSNISEDIIKLADVAKTLSETVVQFKV